MQSPAMAMTKAKITYNAIFNFLFILPHSLNKINKLSKLNKLIKLNKLNKIFKNKIKK